MPSPVPVIVVTAHRAIHHATMHPRASALGRARTSMARALGYPAGVRINTSGDRRTAGGNGFSADGPAVSMTGNGLRAW